MATKTNRPNMYAVQKYNTDTGKWEYVFRGPLGKDEADKEIKNLRRWAKEDGSGQKYRRIPVYLK